MKNIMAIAKITALLIVLQVFLIGSLAQVSASTIRPCPYCVVNFTVPGTTVNFHGMNEYLFGIQTGEDTLDDLVGVLESVGFGFDSFYSEAFNLSGAESNNLGTFSQGEIVGRLDYLFSEYNGLEFQWGAFSSSGGDAGDVWQPVGPPISKEVIFSNILANTILAYSVGDIHFVGLLCDIDGVDELNIVTSVPYNPVPEPATILLLGIGLLGLSGIGRKRSFCDLNFTLMKGRRFSCLS